MPNQHSIEEPSHQTQTSRQAPPEGIVVPLDLPGVRLLSQRVVSDGCIEVSVIATTDRARCPHCGQMSVKIHDTRPRPKRDLPLRSYQVRLILHKRRFHCLPCRRSFTEPDAICGSYRRTTQRLRAHLGVQACLRPVAHLASEMGVGPRFVQDCLEEQGRAHFAEDERSLDEEAPLPTPRFLGIDEFARRKGHCYDTILCDVEHHAVLEVAKGRKQAEVVHLLERLDQPDDVVAVSMDMSSSFREAVRLVLPGAHIVADHFHVIQHVGKAFAKVLKRAASSAEGKTALKGHRHLFLRAKEDLSEQEEQQRTALALAFPELAHAWRLKEALRTWYATTIPTNAALELDAWIATVEREGPAELRTALSAFRNWRQEILAFFAFLPLRLSNGFVEGKNNRTKALMRQAYGYRNRCHLRLRILLKVA
jgi:transposase